MDRVNEQYAERVVATVMEVAGFTAVNKSIVQRLMKFPILLLKMMSLDLSEVMSLKNKTSVGLNDCKYLLERRGENIEHLLHFLKNQSSSRQPVTLCYPFVKPQNANPLKIPEINSTELATQPGYIDDHLPLLRDALEYKSNQKRSTVGDMYKHGDSNNDRHGMNGSLDNDGLSNSERNEQSNKRKYPSEAGRSRYRMRAVIMGDGGEVCCHGLGNRRGANLSPPPATHVNTLMSVIQSNATPADVSYPKTSTTPGRNSVHPKNGIVSGIPDLQNSFAVSGASPSVVACPSGDNRDLNGTYVSPQHELPVVDDDEDVKPSKIWPLKEEPLPSNYTMESLNRKQNDLKPRNMSEWPNSPINMTSNSKMVPSSLTNTPLSIPTQSKPKESLASRLEKSASKKDLTALFSNKSDMLDVLDSPPPAPVVPPPKSSSKSSKKSSSKRPVSKSSSRPKPKSVDVPPTADPPKSNNHSKSQNRKRPYEEALDDSKLEDRSDLLSVADSPLLHSTVERPKPTSSRHKQSKSKGIAEPQSHSSSSSKNKRRKVDNSSTPDSTPRSRIKVSPEVTVGANFCLKPDPDMQHEAYRDKITVEPFQCSTPNESSVVEQRLSSDEDDHIYRRNRKTSRSPPTGNKRRLSEWEDVPLSKRVTGGGNSVRTEARPEEYETPPDLEECGDNDKMVKLGPKLTMKFNLAKIKQDSTSGTASPASTTAPPPAAALETNPALFGGEKIEEEEEIDWVRDHALARRRQRSGSISDGGEDAAVMRFRGPCGPSPPSLPDVEPLPEQPLNLLSGDDVDADERRTSTDSLPPPSLMPTVPLPKIKIQKVKKETTASFITESDMPPTERHPRSKRRPLRRSHSPRSPSPPTLAPALTPPPTECDDSAPTLTLVPPNDPVESVVLEQSEEQTVVEEKYHSQTLLPPSKTLKKSSSGSFSSKKKLSKRSASKSRSRPKVSTSKRARSEKPPVLERSPTPPTPPALLEPACEDLGFGFRSTTSPVGSPCPSSPPPPLPLRPPTPPPPVVSRSKSKTTKGSGSSVSKKGGTASAEKVTSNKSKRAASSSSKTKSHGGGGKAAAPVSASASAPSPVMSNVTGGASASGSGGNKASSTASGDVPMEFTAMGVDVVSHGSSYYFDSHGVQIWICPLCHMEDNGSLMIGCDACDDWYHGRCLNIYAEPDEDTWFCPRCVQKNKSNTPKNKKKPSKTGRRRA